MRKYFFCLFISALLFTACDKDNLKETEQEIAINGGQSLKSYSSINRVKTFYLPDYDENSWYSLQPLAGDMFPVNCIAGTSYKGLIICGGVNGRKLRYMSDYNEDIWISIPDAPFIVSDIAGENSGGPIIVGGIDSKEIAYLTNYEDGTWEYVKGDIPWEVKGVAGVNSKGIAIFGGDNNREVAYVNDCYYPKWTKTQVAPFPIKGIAGENEYGVVIFGGEGDKTNRVAYLTSYSGNWQEVRRAPVNIKRIAGDNKYGPIILGGTTGLEVWYMRSYSSQEWIKLRNVPEMTTVDICGTSKRGPIVVGFE